MNSGKIKNFYKLNLRNYLKVSVIELYVTENFFRYFACCSTISTSNKFLFDSYSSLVHNGFGKQTILRDFTLFSPVKLDDSLQFFSSFINYFNFLGYPSVPYLVKEVFSNYYQFDYSLKNFFEVKKRQKFLPSLYFNKRRSKIGYNTCVFCSFSKNNFQFFFFYLLFYYKLYFWNSANDQTNSYFVSSSLLNMSNFSVKYKLNDLNDETVPYSYKSLVDFNFDILINLHFEKRFGYKLVLLNNSILKIF